MRILSQALVVISIVALLGACGGDDGGSAAATPAVGAAASSTPTSALEAATSTPAPTVLTSGPTANSAGTASYPTPTAVTAAPPTPTAAGRPLLTGQASATDPAGDFVDADANTPDWRVRLLDLAGATVVGDGNLLTVTFGVVEHATLAIREASCRYEFVITLNSTNVYELIASFGPGNPSMRVVDLEAAESIPVDGEPVVSGNTLSASVPVERIPNVEGPFLWHVSTNCLGMATFNSWSDLAPDNGLVPFPQ